MASAIGSTSALLGNRLLHDGLLHDRLRLRRDGLELRLDRNGGGADELPAC